MANVYRLFNLVQLVEKPTRVTFETSTINDHIATTCTRNSIKMRVCEVSLSDHHMVYCIRKFNGAFEKDHKKIKTRNMKHCRKNEFLCDISGICWGQFFYQTDDIDVLVNKWTSMFSFVIEKHAPLKEIRVSERYCLWINKDLKSLMRTRNKIKTAALQRKSRILIDAYRQARNRINSLNVQLKRQYFSAKISEC